MEKKDLTPAFEGPFLSVRRHPDLRRAVRSAVTRGELEQYLPSVYVRPGSGISWRDRVTALRLADPDAVVCGLAAAALTFWPELDAPAEVEATSRLRGRPGFRFTRRAIPRSHRRRLDDGTWVTSRPRTALDLVDSVGGAGIDRALRSGMDLSDLRRVCHDLAGFRGAKLRARLVHESRDRPWSPAERSAHAALHSADVTGWVANLKVFAGGLVVVPDIAFAALRLAIEIDGRSYHDGDASFRGDRARDRRMARAGWLVVRFAAADVLGDPARFAAEVRAIVVARRASLGSG